MVNFPQFDLTDVIGSVKEMSENITAFLNGDSSLANALITHYKSKEAAESVVIAKKHPEYAAVKNGVAGLWLCDCSTDMRKAGHSEWVVETVIKALAGEDD